MSELEYDFNEETQSIRLKLEALKIKYYNKQGDENLQPWIKNLEKEVL